MESKQVAQIAKEDLAAVDPLVRQLLGELATAVWGRNALFRRHWAASHEGLTWRVQHATRPEAFAVRVDFQAKVFRVECRDGPLLTSAISESQLRRALAIAHHRGPEVV